ncbi:MAG: eCIS core domain-containing protein [Acidimicrobiales bacterium]
MGIERHADHWRWVGGPVPPGAAAITIGSLISLRRTAAGNARLIRHEVVHVAQWRRHGFVRFVALYLGAYLRWRLRGHPHWAAYRRIPLEIEASWLAAQPEVRQAG